MMPTNTAFGRDDDYRPKLNGRKQLAVRMLDDRGAFALRRSVESVADAMNVSRFTIYNYLNAAG